MRAYIVLLALLATPLAMGVSQLPGKSSCTNGQGSVNRSAQGTAHAHKGLCVPQDPPGGTGGSGSSGNFNSGGRYNPSTDSWTATATIGAPYPRGVHTAVWTGSEMIV